MDGPETNYSRHYELDGVGEVGSTSARHLASQGPRNYRRTGIICTIGPKTSSLEALRELRAAGLSVVRLNFSHGDYESHRSVIKNVRELEKSQRGRPIAIALDTKGPEIRTGMTRGGESVVISAGKELVVTTDDAYAECCDGEYIYVDYKNIAHTAKPGQTIFIDDGTLEFEVQEILDQKSLRVRTPNGGILRSKKGVNIPYANYDLPSLSVADRHDLRFGIENGVDMIFASLVRSASDVHNVREGLGEEGKHIQVIAKIEDRKGLYACNEIIAAADGVMVARGDFGVELPHAEVFVAQKKLISLCNLAGKPVICATQMLESMIQNPRPTRAEISDVGNAILDGADCVMLSKETSMGNYPVQAVREMHETCLVAEGTIPYLVRFEEVSGRVDRPVSVEEACAMAAVRSSLHHGAGAIIVLSASGETARLVSKYRPICPILMVSRNVSAAGHSHLSRGVYPFIYTGPKMESHQWRTEVDARVKWVITEAQNLRILNMSDPVVVVQGWKQEAGHTSIIRVLTPDAEAAVLSGALEAPSP
ncbi:probable Pyruvate kinase [Cephalotrichum gorgonifer]|uniref:Pyruvate kinase n=1 Tax=Cephalotrichum gorgonifer TaxID=2041049 RepID=A0AAE8N7G4_9PEZI|nr:probable Pyruvate kinase [Cephalotrichum gorgonifer]